MDELDLEEMNAVFLEECRENVDVMERGLLEMGQGNDDSELLNEVFRAAHSIKGGGATFGFLKLSELTHFMETLLDETRSGKRTLHDSDIELLLTAIDVVRALMDAGIDGDDPGRDAIQTKLSEAVDSSASDKAIDAAEEESDKTDTPTNWMIRFSPKKELMTRGNDPLLLVRELHSLGSSEIVLDLESLPSWENFDSRSCYLSWQACVKGSITQDSIEEVFEWVELDCDLKIENITESSASSSRSDLSESGSDSSQKSPVNADRKNASETTSIRIATDKIDQMINLVGELVITQSMLSRIGEGENLVDVDNLRCRIEELERNTRELQESVMRVRMMPMSSGFGRLPRLVRDLSRKLGKNVELKIEGGETEIDKTVLERMMDPLVHLVRNSLDHGLETPEERQSSNKDETGTLLLRAYHRGGSVVIEIIDDGRGIDRDRILQIAIERGVVKNDEILSDEQIYQLIFAPGFSTAKEVSDLSGRGVGMDVVRKNIMDLGGRVDLDSSPGTGTTVKIELPLTLAILDGQLVSAAGQTFVVPLMSIVETLEIKHSSAKTLLNSGGVCRFRGEYVPMIHLSKRLRLKGDAAETMVVIVETHGRLLGIVIDDVLGQQQVVIKALEENYRSVPGIAGATIMSDGSVALILDPPALDNTKNLSEVA